MKYFAFYVIIVFMVLSCANTPEENPQNLPVDTLSTTQSTEEDTSTVNTVNFAVDSVQLASDFLPVYSVDKVLSNQLQRPISYLTSTYDSTEIAPIFGNGLIWTVQKCYDQHRPLILSPDIIWLTICQGVSLHINQNFDSLEAVIFNKNKPDKLIVRNDSLASDADQWGHLINDLSKKTRAYTQPGIYDFFVPAFSTTNPSIKMAYQINLLEAFEKAFTYIGESGCGIPSIKLEGYKRDWKAIFDRLDQLDNFGLSNWKENLKPIIQEFINTYDGKVNAAFWKDIYKNAIEYNGFYISGWIIKFFPYIEYKDEYDYETDFVENRGYRTGISYKPNPYLNGTDYLMSTLSTNHFPSGVSSIDLEWRDYFENKTTDMLIKGGFFGMEQFADKSLKPFISWAVVEKNGKELPYKNMTYHTDTITHTIAQWSPKIVNTIQDSAIYDIKNFKYQKESLAAVKKILNEAINTNKTTSDIDLTNNVVEFVVLSNGELTNFEIKGSESENDVLLNLIKKELINLPKPWFAATAYPKDMLRLMPALGKPIEGKVAANSRVEIQF